MTDTLSPVLLDLGLPGLSVDNIEEHLPKIISTIEEDCSNPNFLQLLTFVLGQFASQLEIDVLDCKLLKDVLPTVKCTFDHSLSEIKIMLEESDEMDEEVAISISKALQACLDILSGYGELLEVLSRDTVEASQIESLNRTLPLLLVEAFLHCKDSEGSYGPYFEESTSILTTFFRKSYEVQIKYYKLLEDKIIFSSQFEEDLNCLADVLESIIKMTEIVTSLDLKTCADSWKVYGKLYTKHALDLKNTSDIANAIRLLSAHIRQIVASLTNSEDSSSDKQQLKLLKIGKFLLTVVIKLCEMSECNFRQGWDDILELVLLLFSCSRTNVLNNAVKVDLRRFICIGAAPLLSVLLKDSQFFKAYGEVKDHHQNLTSSSKVGLLFLTLSIMKNIVERRVPTFWNSFSMIALFLDLFSSCGPLIDLGCPFEGKDAYSSAISICAAYFVATVDETSFSHLENEIVSKLFQSELHSAVFASDFLCLLGRLTSDQYCLHVATYLCEALQKWTHLHCDSAEFVIIGTTVRRLSALMLPSSRATLQSQFTSTQVRRWFDEFSEQDVVEKFRYFLQNPSRSSFTSLVSCPPLKNGLAERIQLENETVDAVIRGLAFIKDVKERSNEEYTWCNKFLHYSLRLLLDAWVIQGAEQLLEILNILRSLLIENDEEVAIILLDFLRESTPSVIQIDPNPQLVRALAAIIIKMLGMSNTYVVIGTLEMLKELDRSPTHKEIVLLVSSHSEAFVNMINHHFLQNSTDTPVSYYNVMNSLVIPEHACQERKTGLVNADNPPAKKFKTESGIAGSLLHNEIANVASSIERLSSEVSFLKRVHSNVALTEDMKCQLNSIIQDLARLAQ